MKISVTILGVVISMPILFAALAGSEACGKGHDRPRQALSMVPGARLGIYSLSSDGAQSLEQMGKPVAMESANSETQRVFNWGGQTLFFVHTLSNRVTGAEPPDGVTIDLLRFSCPTETGVKTANGIHTGSSLAEVRNAFPDAQPVANAPWVYDDVKQGIAFEFEKSAVSESPCIAITIHVPGQSRIVTQQQVEALLKKAAKH
ncbi:MAG: hypothetical protein JOZ08_11310 [Verrucomicrobia bacterium]|nr:hypothetical protein [Verrucomicrobiota bacterium]